MSKKKVISIKSLPTRPPILFTMALLALLKSFNASQVVWTVSITLLVVVWLALIYTITQEEQTEVKL